MGGSKGMGGTKDEYDWEEYHSMTDVARDIRDRRDGVLAPKYKLWNGFEF